ncbi:MAG: LysM peptidoglycan-binding domain-containing protein [Dehalococcoidia bacterium]|nr:LysM peptidoglycan-binding domain-containing protein [Dehalococcoidia bacterium]
MAIKLGAGALVLVLLVVLFQGKLFGGGDNDPPGSVGRRGSIPTATPPANPPEPILLGEIRASGAGTTSAAAGGEGTYVVKSGDTLAGIAISLNVSAGQQAAWLAEVLRLNGIADARLLNVGDALRLPRLPTATPGPRPSATPATAATPTRTAVPQAQATAPAAPTQAASTATPRPTTVPVAGGGGAYTVVSGDFPLAIAEKLGVPAAQQEAWAQQLLALNNTTASALQVGQVLQLPAGTPSGGAIPAPTATPIP